MRVPLLIVRPSALALFLCALILTHAGAAAGQTSMVPYYGKNFIHYDKFDWHIYTTDHFEIYYYPELEHQLERVAGYAESAYQKVSADLKHDLPAKVPLILFKTHSEFEQQNVASPAASGEGVGAFAESTRNRILLPIDDPPDRLYGLITHELTHIFEFDIIPQGLIRQSVPLWVNEGLADYERGQWTPLDLMAVRDAAIADVVPKMSELQGYGGGSNPRLIYNLGHAVFEFIEARYGKEGIRQFLFSLRKSVIGGGGGDAYEESLRMTKDEFDQAFDRYLKDRFKPFRDKERPADYGRNLAPNREKTHFAEALSIAPSPSGDLIAAVTVNRKDRELDIVLVSSKDGSVVRNVTAGFDKDLGFANLVLMGAQFEMPSMSWAPQGDRLAYFVRTDKERTLIVQNVLTKRIEERLAMKSVDEPRSPDFTPDGRTIVFAALRAAVGDIFTVDLDTEEVVNLTNDNFADFAPTYSPDGTYIVYVARVSGNQKLFRLDLDTKKKTQLTFGTQDETAAQFLDDHTLVFSSTATDPTVPLEPEVAKNGNIYNIWTLDLRNGELRQYTDALGGNWSPIVLNGGKTSRIGFISYYKGEYSLHTLERKEPQHTASTSDFGAPGPIIDFQAPLQHTLVKGNQKKKRMFDKMFLDGRPPVNVGVTNNGDVFGGTTVTFSDVLGDQQFSFFAASISQYRTMALSYVNLSRRFQYALQGFDQTQFFFGQGGVFYDPAFASLFSPSQAVATRSVRGGSVIGMYPFDRYHRVELSTSVMQLREQFSDPVLQQEVNALNFQAQQFGQPVFRDGTLVAFGAAFVQETTVFREFGPLAGSTMRLAYDVAPSIGSSLSRQTLDADARYYQRLGGSGVLATRIRGYKSFGDFPDFLYFGGNSEMRGYDYLQFAGQNVVFANAELRFPLIEAALTPIGVIGSVRGVFFANIGGGWFSGQQSADPCSSSGYEFFTSSAETCQVVTGVRTNALGQVVLDPTTGLPIVTLGPEQTISGFRLKDGRASYGVGLETFALGFPIHFDWSWRTLFNRSWEDVLFASSGGSSAFRKPRFAVWIGYDF